MPHAGCCRRREFKTISFYISLARFLSISSLYASFSSTGRKLMSIKSCHLGATVINLLFCRWGWVSNFLRPRLATILLEWDNRKMGTWLKTDKACSSTAKLNLLVRHFLITNNPRRSKMNSRFRLQRVVRPSSPYKRHLLFSAITNNFFQKYKIIFTYYIVSGIKKYKFW